MANEEGSPKVRAIIAFEFSVLRRSPAPKIQVLVKQAKNASIWLEVQRASSSCVHSVAPPLCIQEKVQPKVLIDDLRRQTEKSTPALKGERIDPFADFNGLPSEDAKTEFYQHDAHWSNRMILGDSLQVMASLAEREGLRGKVQCIYIDPPHGIKFNSNFQWSSAIRDLKDGSVGHITREPEQVKAFRDTWRDGVHSYLTYLRDHLTVARDLQTDSGSIGQGLAGELKLAQSVGLDADPLVLWRVGRRGDSSTYPDSRAAWLPGS